jgi:CRISPR-associated protein Cas1
MIKKTLYFGNPAYLKKSLNQVKVEFPDGSDQEPKTVPIEDIGILILDNPRITITQALLSELLENNTAVLSCDQRHLPLGLFMPMASNHIYTEKLRFQLESSEPLRKNLWQQTVKAKIQNQAALLENEEKNTKNMHYWSRQVRSGDPDNYEARAAAYYWANYQNGEEAFVRGRFEEAPNNLLNYGYAILRAVVARSLVSSGMLPAIGIHHRNKYNPFCLADDIMEPYRPYVDVLVKQISEAHNAEEIEYLTTSVKRQLLIIPRLDVMINGMKSPLMIAVQRTTASLMQCFEGEKRKITYPTLIVK